MKYRLEIHADDLKLLKRYVDTDYRIYYRFIENETGEEVPEP